MVPKVSVIIPTYNRAELLKQAIVSVVNQTYSDYEIIIVDDGSSDHTREVVEELTNQFSAKKIHFLSQNHLGRSAARNKGISFAKGEYISFLDDDDMYLPNKLTVQVDFLEKNKNYGMVYSAYYMMDYQGSVRQGTCEVEPLNGWIYPKLISFIGNQICTPSVMIRSQVLKEVGGFDTDMDVCEDLDLWRRVAKLYWIGQIIEPLVVVRENKKQEEILKEMIAARLKYYRKAFKEDPNLSNSVYKNVLLVELFLRGGIYNLLSGYFVQSIELLCKGIHISPLLFLKETFSISSSVIRRRIKRLFNLIQSITQKSTY